MDLGKFLPFGSVDPFRINLTLNLLSLARGVGCEVWVWRAPRFRCLGWCPDSQGLVAFEKLDQRLALLHRNKISETIDAKQKTTTTGALLGRETCFCLKLSSALLSATGRRCSWPNRPRRYPSSRPTCCVTASVPWALVKTYCSNVHVNFPNMMTL